MLYCSAFLHSAWASRFAGKFGQLYDRWHFIVASLVSGHFGRGSVWQDVNIEDVDKDSVHETNQLLTPHVFSSATEKLTEITFSPAPPVAVTRDFAAVASRSREALL